MVARNMLGLSHDRPYYLRRSNLSADMTHKIGLDAEILASFDKDEWKSAAGVAKETVRYVGYAAAALAKDKRVNIRICPGDLEEIQVKAAQEGLPTNR